MTSNLTQPSAGNAANCRDLVLELAIVLLVNLHSIKRQQQIYYMWLVSFSRGQSVEVQYKKVGKYRNASGGSFVPDRLRCLRPEALLKNVILGDKHFIFLQNKYKDK